MIDIRAKRDKRNNKRPKPKYAPPVKGATHKDVVPNLSGATRTGSINFPWKVRSKVRV